MIYLVGEAPESVHYKERSFDSFMSFMRRHMDGTVQLDIETNVTDYWCTKKLITLQFGTLDGTEQWVIQWSHLPPSEKEWVKFYLEEIRITWVIHNAAFECIVLLFHGIRLRKVYDTMLAEMVLHCGEFAQEDDDVENNEAEGHGGYYSLAETYYRYFQRILDKSEQMSFGDDILTESKIIYAANDVKYLGLIRRDQLMLLVSADLDWVAALEMEAVLGYAEMTYHGMELDVDKWLANLELALPVQQQAREKLDAELIDPNGPFRKKAIELGYFSPEDRVTINWKSPSQKKLLVDRFFPPLSGRVGVPALRALMKKLDKQPEPLREWIVAFHDEDWPKIEKAMIETDREWLIANEFIIPGGAVTINWGAWQQTLPIFQCHMPKLKSTSAKGAGGMGNFYHPIGVAFREWKDSMKLTTTYGHKFVDEHVEPDGKVRTTFNQILSTGRLSSRKPNMQQIPVRDPIGPRYRNAFVADKEWGYVSSDYIQQELVITAYVSNEKVWLEALKKRQDLHMICAELVFKKEWEKATEDGCVYYKEDAWSEKGRFWASEHPDWAATDWKRQPRKAKCKCKGHKRMREPTKNLDFGLIYGLSKYKFAGDMRWTVQRAEAVITDYFNTFPSLERTLTYLGNFSLHHGFIQTLNPFFRKRYFSDWKYYKREEIEAHIAEIKFDKTLAHMQRASKNQPIQGTAADITKLSLVMLYWKIHDELQVSDKVRLVCQVHDQNDTQVTDDYRDTWAPIMEKTMEEAALFIIPNGLLRAETTCSPVWTK